MKNAETGLIHGDLECQYKHFTAKVGTPIDPDAAIDVECFMTTDTPDADEEVMLPDGIDLTRFVKNPVVMLCHAMGQPGCYYPLPVGRAVWTRRVKRGVIAGVKFSEKSEMGREVRSLFEENMLRSFSVGFRPLEASQMTRKEAESRPDWAEAFERTKGHVRVHRKWSLIELSVAPIPSNPDALVTTYKAKGIVVPSWLNLKSEDHMDDENPEVTSESDSEDKAAECKCGDGDEKCEACQARMQAKDEDDPEEPEEPEAKAMHNEPDGDEPEEPDDDENTEAAGFKRGDHVKVKAPHYKGVGVVQGVHRKGIVPHADNDLMASKEDPAARVKCYKAMGDGHTPTDFHIAVKCAHMSKMDTPMVSPTKGKALASSNSPVGEKSGPLPELVCLSDHEIAQKALKQINQIPDLVRAEVARITGVV